MRVLKAHSSSFDVLIVAEPDTTSLGAGGLTRFVRAACDYSGPLGATGVYVVDTRQLPARVSFLTADGRPGSVRCLDGLRCVGRFVAETTGTATPQIRLGDLTFDIVADSPGESASVSIAPRLALSEPSHHGQGATWAEVRFDRTYRVALVDRWDLSTLRASTMGGGVSLPGIDTTTTTLAMTVPGTKDELVIGTSVLGEEVLYSSGGCAAAAIVAAAASEQERRRFLVRTFGGHSEVEVTRVADGYHLVESGNATFVYTATVDPDEIVFAPEVSIPMDAHVEEILRFGDEYDSNMAILRALNIVPPG